MPDDDMTKLEDLKLNLIEKQSDRAQLRNTLTRLQAKKRTLDQEMASLKELTTVGDESTNCEDKITELNTSIDELETDVERLNEQINMDTGVYDNDRDDGDEKGAEEGDEDP